MTKNIKNWNLISSREMHSANLYITTKNLFENNSGKN